MQAFFRAFLFESAEFILLVTRPPHRVSARLCLGREFCPVNWEGRESIYKGKPWELSWGDFL